MHRTVNFSDRAVTADGVARIHQEDFCQALGVPPERKYAGEGGPTFRDSFAPCGASRRDRRSMS